MKDPEVQSVKWMKGIGELLGKLEKVKTKAGLTSKFPSDMGNTYFHTFGKAIQKLKETREFLEDHGKTSDALKVKSGSADEQAPSANDDLAAFGTLYKTYET